MLRELTQNELATISGGGITDITSVYPEIPLGYEIYGWNQIITWETFMWKESVGLFTEIEHVQELPTIYIEPLYRPIVTTVYYY